MFNLDMFNLDMINMRWIIVLIPLLLSTLQQMVFPSNFQKNKKVFFQPPGYVFGVVWTILYLMLGLYAFRLLNEQKKSLTSCDIFLFVLFVFNIIINLAWTPVVNNLRMFTTGIYMIATMITITLIMIVLENDKINKALLIPYLSWLFFALLLNIELARLYKPVQVKFEEK